MFLKLLEYAIQNTKILDIQPVWELWASSNPEEEEPKPEWAMILSDHPGVEEGREYTATLVGTDIDAAASDILNQLEQEGRL